MFRSLHWIRWTWMPVLLILSGCGQKEPVKDLQLENGLRVVFTRAQSPITSAVFLTDYGDADGSPGLARMTNLALLKGTAIRTGEQVVQEFESTGGLVVIETGLTSSVVGVQSPSANFEDCFRMLCECLSQSTFDSTELSRTDANRWALDKEQKSGFLLKTQVWNDQDVRARLYPKTALDRRLSSDVPGYSRNEVVAFARDHLRPERMVLSVAGACPRRQILSMLRRTWKVPQKRPVTAVFDTTAGDSRTLPEPAKRRGGAGDVAIIAVKGMKVYTDAFLGEYLAMHALELEKGHGFVKALAEQGIRQAVPMQYMQYEDDYTYAVIQTSVPAGTGGRVLEFMMQELEETAARGISQAAFQTARRRLESSLAIQSQYTIRNAYYGARAAQLDIPCRTLSSLQARVGKITLDEVNRSLTALIRRSRTWVAPAGKP